MKEIYIKTKKNRFYVYLFLNTHIYIRKSTFFHPLAPKYKLFAQ